MYYVYILISKKDRKLYVGCTQDIKNRLHRHNSGFVEATKVRRPLELLYYEEISDKTEAFQRERYLKSLWSARFKKKLRQKYFDNLK
jgi:putative endonuclease